MKIINAIDTSRNNNPLIEPPSSTIMFSIKITLLFFINARAYMSQRLDRPKKFVIYIYIYIYIFKCTLILVV